MFMWVSLCKFFHEWFFMLNAYVNTTDRTWQDAAIQSFSDWMYGIRG